MDCVLCHPQKENVVWKNKELRVIQVDDPLFPGYFRVIWNKHIAEMSDLTDDERQLLEKVLLTVEKVVREQMQPDKINWAQFGNMVPHLGWLPQTGAELHSLLARDACHRNHQH